ILRGEDFSIDINLLNKDRFKGELNEEDYVVGIRAEYFELSKNPLFKVKIESTELIGKDCILNFDVNGKISKSITDTHNKITEGEEVGFDIDYNSIYIFKENGVRVY
ncbi:MAG: ABC transporter ATP-binding protein, partial [Peptostreptococcaceae bacterium]|nr:ABC transporter ATP-binding protein [Peptostreptococcaceae bacterium]